MIPALTEQPTGSDGHGAAPRGDLRVVICGTFHRDLGGLADSYHALLRAGCEILSPADVVFVDEVEGFVRTADEVGEAPAAIEYRHISALQQADFVWLHAPDGYVGSSAALELGVAHAFGIPVVGRELPTDVTLRHFVERVASVDAAVQRRSGNGSHTPARPLEVLQLYYARMARDRGYARESAQDAMLLLTEEVGELARAIRRSVGLQRDGGYADEDVGAELADIQLYILHLANVLGVELATAVRAKERHNFARAKGRAIAA